VRLPDFPGVARQALCGIIVGEQLYCWGGYSYSSPYCYRDGFRLTCKKGQWTWDALPDLPWAVGDSGISVMGSKIYVAGGSDYDANKFYTNADRAGKVKRLGTRLLAIDTNDLHAGWKELAPCPGTPRWGQAVAVVAGKLFVFGGGTGFDNPTGTYATVVDNWRYDPATDSWRRLANLPIASSVFPSGRIVVFDRYIVLIGGCQYQHVIGPDGAVNPVYGKPFRHYPDRDCFSDVFVYDTKRDRFGTASPLPLNDCRPLIVAAGDRVHLIGGETFGAVVEGEPFAHHPDLYLVGTIRAIVH
jgi:N-acetylneuraminic acid mutarotase